MASDLYTDKGQGLRGLLLELEEVLIARAFFSALFISLAIPDICGALGSKDGEATSGKYKNWFDSCVATKYGDFFDGQECYHLRCSFLHQGALEHSKSHYKKVIFALPNPQKTVLHRNILNGVLNLQLDIFCMDILEGAKIWLGEVQGTDPFKKNHQRMMRIYDQGIEGIIKGLPFIS